MPVEQAAPQVRTNRTCPLCGGDNQCAPAASGSFNTECWCTKATIDPAAIARIPSDQLRKTCLCPRCAGVHAKQNHAQ